MTDHYTLLIDELLIILGETLCPVLFVMMVEVDEGALANEGYMQLNQRYLINRLLMLGSGTFGKVYKGYDTYDRRFVAIKHVPRKNIDTNREAQIREIKIMEKLDHPNIMRYYGSEGGPSSPDGLFIFLELCEGGTLSKKLTTQLTELETINIIRQLADGMAYMNQKCNFCTIKKHYIEI